MSQQGENIQEQECAYGTAKDFLASFVPNGFSLGF